MREECRHFESREYANGDTVRKCDLDLAPDAPWRCPDDCPAYERRLYDAGWSWGTLERQPPPPEPPGLDDGSAAALLDQAEDILNAAGPEILAQVRAEQDRPGLLGRLFRRRRR
jgi:hypothetical protein